MFDIRTDESHTGFIETLNRGLDSVPDNPYLARFGHGRGKGDGGNYFDWMVDPLHFSPSPFPRSLKGFAKGR